MPETARHTERQRRPERPRSQTNPSAPEESLGDLLRLGIGKVKSSLHLVFSQPDESERRNNSRKAQAGELAVNRPKNERIANLKELTSLSLFQPDSEIDEHQGGMYGYNRSLNYYLDNLINRVSPPSSFEIFTKGADGTLHPKTIKNRNGRIFFGSEEIYPHFYQNRWRFPEPFLEDCIAYKVTDETATYIGIKPCLNNTTLRGYIRTVTEGNEDVTMLQYRGHNGYGAGANIPEDLLDPALVFLGGCKSNRFLKKAQKHHYRSGLLALTHKTGWETNHYRTRIIMSALKQLKKDRGNNITWEDLSDYLRATANRRERFGKEKMILPGDEID
ncbi:MAG: hypothetical protein WCX95_01930 [Candidatus Gracilibacteria bacterium]